MFYEICQTPLGDFYALESEGYLIGFSPFLQIDKIQRKGTPTLRQTCQQVQAYFEKKRSVFNLPLCLRGSDFQKQVWREIMKIDYGKTKSYKQIAESFCSSAFRAVGSACGKNPICIIVPCHRVIPSQNKNDLISIGGYAIGSESKEFLLRLEGIMS